VIVAVADTSKPIKCERLGVEANASDKSLFKPITRAELMLVVRLTLAALSSPMIFARLIAAVMLSVIMLVSDSTRARMIEDARANGASRMYPRPRPTPVVTPMVS
jgi:hypothetical protein